MTKASACGRESKKVFSSAGRRKLRWMSVSQARRVIWRGRPMRSESPDTWRLATSAAGNEKRSERREETQIIHRDCIQLVQVLTHYLRSRFSAAEEGVMSATITVDEAQAKLRELI